MKKLIKSDLESGERELNSANVALTKSKKENKEISHKFEKQVKQMDLKVKDLENYKLVEVSEEREFRAKNKKVEKKIKSLKVREANLELEKTKYTPQTFSF